MELLAVVDTAFKKKLYPLYTCIASYFTAYEMTTCHYMDSTSFVWRQCQRRVVHTLSFGFFSVEGYHGCSRSSTQRKVTCQREYRQSYTYNTVQIKRLCIRPLVRKEEEGEGYIEGDWKAMSWQPPKAPSTANNPSIQCAAYQAEGRWACSVGQI